jgi:hypothetical protein
MAIVSSSLDFIAWPAATSNIEIKTTACSLDVLYAWEGGMRKKKKKKNVPPLSLALPAASPP